MYRSTSSALMYFPSTWMGFPPKKVYLVRPILLECLKLFPTWCKESFICLLRHWRGISIFTWYWCAALKQERKTKTRMNIVNYWQSLFFFRLREESALAREWQRRQARETRAVASLASRAFSHARGHFCLRNVPLHGLRKNRPFVA